LKFKRVFILFVITGMGAWILVLALRPHLPTASDPIQVYSNQRGSDLKLVLLRAFAQAKQSIYLQIYALTDPEVQELLRQKSLAGVEVTVFFDKKASPHLAEELVPWGIEAYPVQTSGLMHRKIFVIDGETVYLGSANLTTASLTLHDNVILGFWSPELAAFCRASARESGNFTVGGFDLRFFFLPEAKEEALEALLQQIRGAKKEILAALFTLTHPQIVAALQEAGRSIEVKLAIDYYSKRGASHRAIASLEKDAIIGESLGAQLLHHKWALIDREVLAMGSANWTEAAFEKNQDYLLILSPARGKLRRSFETIWKKL
jgi:phosphatidylserine/phosphatidylglycerophosphate/cardiolipin synthase-like enzyme